MSQATQSLGRVLRWLWRHTAAAIALALIILAFVVGMLVGGDGGGAPAQRADSMHAGHNDEPAVRFYTCSMHPQIRLTDPAARCPICHMELIPVDDGGSVAERQIVFSEAAMRLAQIETTPVARFFPTAEVRLYGKISYDQTRVARITSYFPGRLDRLFVDYVGIPVREGDHLAEIYSPELLSSFEELRQVRLAMDSSTTPSEIVRSSTQRTLEAAREKLRLFGLTPEQIDRAERGDATSDQFTIFSPIGGVVTDLAALEGDYVDTGSPIATVADLSRLWLDLEAYESQLPFIHWGQQITFTIESHPGETFDGQVSFIEPIVDDNTRTAAVRVAVDNSDGRLKPGMFAVAVAHTRVSDHGAVGSADFADKWVCPMHPEIVEDGAGACSICQMDLVLATDLSMAVAGATGRAPLVIPKSAALITGQRAVAYRRLPEAAQPTFEGVEIVLGPRAGDFYIVRDGLREGDEVVTNGAFKIDSAMQIEAKPSMMSPSGGSPPVHEHGAAPASTPTTPLNGVPSAFVRELAPLYDAYLVAQEALANDDVEGFDVAAQRISLITTAVDTTSLDALQTENWDGAAIMLTDTPAASDIASARAGFEHLSMAVLELERLFGHAGDAPLYEAFCPMAFDFRGASWLQRDGEVIWNPYFGASMLRCGEIRETFAPVGDSEHTDD